MSVRVLSGAAACLLLAGCTETGRVGPPPPVERRTSGSQALTVVPEGSLRKVSYRKVSVVHALTPSLVNQNKLRQVLLSAVGEASVISSPVADHVTVFEEGPGSAVVVGAIALSRELTAQEQGGVEQRARTAGISGGVAFTRGFYLNAVVRTPNTAVTRGLNPGSLATALNSMKSGPAALPGAVFRVNRSSGGYGLTITVSLAMSGALRPDMVEQSVEDMLDQILEMKGLDLSSAG